MHLENTLCYLLFEVNTAASISKIGHVCKAEACLIHFAEVCFALTACKLLVLVSMLENNKLNCQ